MTCNSLKAEGVAHVFSYIDWPFVFLLLIMTGLFIHFVLILSSFYTVDINLSGECLTEIVSNVQVASPMLSKEFFFFLFV